MTDSACCVWDFRMSLLDDNGKAQYLELDSDDEGIDLEEFGLDSRSQREELQHWLKEYTKKWCFQLEAGKSEGYLHFQGRFSLKTKLRKKNLMTLFDQNELEVPYYLEPTSKDVAKSNDFFYVMKADTRIEGPWTDSDKEVFIPILFRDFIDNMYPYLEHIVNYVPVDRTHQRIRDEIYGSSINYFRDINYLYDPLGNLGKSVTSALAELTRSGIDVPPIFDSKELVQIVCDICEGRQERSPTPIIFDLPRTVDAKKIPSLYTAIELVKKGKLYDPRHKYKCWWINSPDIWVFSNRLPDFTFLTEDRWRIWTVDEVTKKLKKYIKPEEVSMFDLDQSF